MEYSYEYLKLFLKKLMTRVDFLKKALIGNSEINIIEVKKKGKYHKYPHFKVFFQK